MSKLINKNIIKAMTIGISAVMAASSMNLSAFAEEATNTTPEPITPDGDEEQTAATASQLAIVLDSIGTLEDQKKGDIVDDVHDAESDFNTAQTSYDTAFPAPQEAEAQPVVEPDARPVEEAEPQQDGENILPADGNAQQPAAENAEKAKTATEYVEEVADKLDNMDTQDTLIAGAYSNANSKATDANTEVGVGEALEKEANDLLGIVPEGTEGETVTLIDIIVGADEIVDEQSEVIAGATTEGEAQEAYDTAATAVAGASKNVDDTQSELTRIEGELAASKEKYDAAVSARDGILADLATAQQNYETLKEQASEAAENAKSELERLSGLAAGYEDDANAALAAYNSTGYGLIAALENGLKDGTIVNKWDNYKKLVNAIMQFYYIPDVLGDTNATNFKASWNNSSAYKKSYNEFSEAAREYDEKHVGDSLNYCKITYKVGRETKTMLVNYKTVDENRENAYSGLVIFEKTEHLVLDSKDLSDAIKNGVDADGYYFDEAGNAYGKNSEGNYVKFVAAQPVAGDEIPTANTIDESTLVLEDGATATDVQLSEDHVAISVDQQTGAVTKTVTKDVTTTTYTGKTLTSTANDDIEAVANTTYDDEASAKNAYIAAVQEAINALADNQTITIGSGENAVTYHKGDTATDAGFELDTNTQGKTTGYTVSVHYNNKFSETTTISGVKEHELFEINLTNWEKLFQLNNEIDDSDAKEAFRQDAQSWIDDEIDKYEYKDGIIPYVGDQFVTAYIGSSSSYDGSQVINQEHHTWGKKLFSSEPLVEWDTNDRTYTGTATVEYAKLSKLSVDSGFFDILFKSDDGAKKVLKANGIENFEYVAMNKANGDGGNYDIYYYLTDASKDVTINVSDSIKAASDITADDIKNAVAEGNANNFTYDLSTATANYATTYGYKALKYLITTYTKSFDKSEANTETKTVSTTTWNEIAAKSFTEYRNDNWYSGNVLLVENDKTGADYTTDGKSGDTNKTHELNEKQSDRTADFRSKVDGAATIAANYAKAAQDAADAQSALDAAAGRVAELKEQLEELKATGGTLTEVSAWAASLADAQQALTDAITKRDELVKKLADLEKQFNDKVDEIRAAEAAAAAAAAAATTTTTTTIAATEAPAAVAPAVAAPAPAPAPAPAVANPDNPANQVVDNNADDNTQNTETIENEESALAEGIGEKQTENIEGDETALSEGIGTETAKKNWPWWWILIVAAVTGGTTFGVIKGNQKKKATEETKKTDK